jgi:hypothetical protein
MKELVMLLVDGAILLLLTGVGAMFFVGVAHGLRNRAESKESKKQYRSAHR